MLALRPAGMDWFRGLTAASLSIAGQHASHVIHSLCSLKMHAAQPQMHLVPAPATLHVVSQRDT